MPSLFPFSEYWWLYLVFTGGVLVLLALRTPTEEAKLIERYGDVYRDYMQRTGRFIPRF